MNPIYSTSIVAVVIIVLCILFWPRAGLLSRFRRARRFTERILVEDTLKHMHACEMEGQQPSVQTIAGVLQISPNQVADILSSMETAELLVYDEGQLRLTSKGRRSALHILRAHRLWERYLADETGFDEAEWHHRAEMREHFLSPEELNRLSAQLGHPTHDPHGDPIPSAEGEFVSHGGKPLPTGEIGELMRIVHIEDEPSMIYAQLIAEGLYPGMRVRIVEKSRERIRFWADSDEHILAPIVAHNLSVIVEPETEEPTAMPCDLLSCLDIGQRGKVIGISPACRGAERRRLLDLGLLQGAIIRAEYRSPSGDPTAYRIRDALIALRKEQADYIFVDLTPEEIHEHG